MMTPHQSTRRVCLAVCGVLLATLAIPAALQQQTPVQFGGAYSGLGARRQQLVDDWVKRFTEATGQKVEAGPFYDEVVSFSAKTTFDAVTHALMTTTLTDASGASLGDALSLLERVESVRGEVARASGDRQFRIYVRLVEGAVDTLARSKEFKRGTDNTVYHKGYPISYRQQGGVPSIQISVAVDGRRADVDVDYRSAGFPAAVFNGHLSAANSDVRAGDNSDRHSSRWLGLQSWWRGFFGGGRTTEAPKDSPFVIPRTPRAGKQDIEVMVRDFLNAWLVEGNVTQAMGFISERAYACVAQDSDDPTDYDRGMAPFQLMVSLKTAHDSLVARSSLAEVVSGVRFPTPGLRVVDQPNHGQFVVYSVPDDVAAEFDCESRLTLGAKKVSRAYGNYFGATFNVNARKDHTVALLWANEDGYWKVVSWRSGAVAADEATPDAPPDTTIVRIPVDADFARAARTFLDAWLIRKDYDAAFRYLSQRSYACYNLVRGPDQPAATSLDEAGQRVRANLERAGDRVGKARSLDEVLVAAESLHAAVRVMDHPDSRTFSIASIPNAIADAYDCAARTRGEPAPTTIPLEYGKAMGTTVRFRTQGGEPAVLRLMWGKENGAWRITAYDVELP